MYNHSMANITEILTLLRQERARIDAAIQALALLDSREARSAARTSGRAVSFNPSDLAAPKKRVVSKAARARMAAAQKARRERERKALA
jgi:hypothetical protein